MAGGGGGLRGRPRKPTKLRLLEGNRGKRPLPKNEPDPESGEPDLPHAVRRNPVALGEWKRLASLAQMKRARVLTLADGPMLEATARAYAEYESAASFVEENGETYECPTKGGGIMIRKYPQVEIAADAWRRYVTGLTHFGLSPMTRGKVERIGDDEDNRDPAEGHFG